MEKWKGLASVTLIGSMPHGDRKKAIDLIFGAAPEVPVWPQLATFPAEKMMVQYNEGLPGLRNEDGRTVVRTDAPEFEKELYTFYEEYLEIEAGARTIEESRFAMGPETSETLHAFLDALGTAGLPLRAVKGQIAGPFTLLAGLKDQDGRALLFDERLQDAVPKLLAMKARWQAERLSAFGAPAIIFIDEPALAGFGSSAFISVSRELVGQLLKEVTESIQGAGALAGIHVCANTDWQLAFDAGLDVINFDAYNYMDRFGLYREACAGFLRRGGNIAWGIVPTLEKEAIRDETPEGLSERLLEGVRQFATGEFPEQKILEQSLITPSCGCDSLPEDLAERVLALTAGVGRIVKTKMAKQAG
jgi:methionine synthase II (cobalamin-independent)